MSDGRNILLSGADKVGINTGAIANPHVITEMMDLFGRQCIVVAIDAKRNYVIPGAGGSNAGDGHNIADAQGRDIVIFNDHDNGKFWFEVHTYGGKKGTGIDAVRWAAEAQRLGAGEILLTSMDRDGTKDGYDTILTGAVVDAVPIPVVASGGCGSPADMGAVFTQTDVDAALAASIFHYQEHGVAGVKAELAKMGIRVRL